MYISIDLGGTNTRVASSKDLKNLYRVEKFPTDSNFSIQQGLVIDAISKVSEGEKIKAICFGVPGMIDKKNKKFLKVPRFSPLNDKSFGEFLEPKFSDTRLVVENDAALAGLAEASFGSGKGFDVAAYLTLSTGVGGARIEKGNIGEGRFEPGHQIIVENGRYNPRCGQHGCLEAYVSGEAFVDIYGINPKNCINKKIWDEYTKYLAVGLIGVSAMWGPDVIILGGSMSNKFDLFYPLLMNHLSEEEFVQIPKIVKASLGDDRGLLGGFLVLS